MVGEAEWGAVVVDLANVVTLAQDAVTPRRNASLFRSIVHIGADVVLVGGEESNAGLGIVRERKTGNHLEVELPYG